LQRHPDVPTVDRSEGAQHEVAGLLGQTTRFSESINRDATSKTTRSVNEVGRPLLYPAEFAELAPEIIIAKKGGPPIRTRPFSRVDRRFRHYEQSA